MIAEREAREARPVRRPAQTDVKAQRRDGLRLALARRAAKETGAAEPDHFFVTLMDAAHGHRAFEPAIYGQARHVEPPPPLNGPERASAEEMVACPRLAKCIPGARIKKRL